MAMRMLNRDCFRRFLGCHKSGVPGLHFRQTTADDYDDVVSIRKHLYDGLDYIPGDYHELLKHNTGIAGFIGGTMVSFMFASVIDDGQSVLMQSGRVREEYVGRGILAQKKKYCYNSIAESSNRSVMCTTKPATMKLLQQKGARAVFQRNAIIFKTTKQALERASASSEDNDSKLVTVDERHLEKVFRSCKTRYLFPENRIIVKRVPYQLVASNIRCIFNTNAKLFASFLKDEDQMCNNVPSLLSSMTSTPCEAGTVIFLDFYGGICDSEQVAAHICKQLSYFRNTCKDSLVLYVTYGKEHHIGTVDHLLSTYSWKATDFKIIYGIEEII